MFSQQYYVSTEFELYGALLRDLTTEEILMPTNRVFCFEKVEVSLWRLRETFETTVDAECAKFFQTRKDSFFQAIIGASGTDAIFYGQQMNLLCRFLQGRLTPVDFEDLNPNQAFLDFEKQELRESVAFLKKVLQEE